MPATHLILLNVSIVLARGMYKVKPANCADMVKRTTKKRSVTTLGLSVYTRAHKTARLQGTRDFREITFFVFNNFYTRI